jgi:hypothetical protein
VEKKNWMRGGKGGTNGVHRRLRVLLDTEDRQLEGSFQVGYAMERIKDVSKGSMKIYL